jgi:peptidoglycan glycosyltransferase
MNRPILRLYGLVVLLFALLVGFTSRWAIFDAASLRENPLNKRALLEQERIQRGAILAADGTVLAHSPRTRKGTYERTYPAGELFAAPIGYSYTDPGRTGLELYRNSALTGSEGENLQSLLDQLQGRSDRGDHVLTTLVPNAQQAAMQALAGHHGAVVALDPRSGAVEVMASSPSYDPNAMRSPATAAQVEHSSEDPLDNRATQYGYAPGSTFKIVTATAALNSGAFTPNSTLSGRDGIPISGVPLDNDNHTSYGQITLTHALAESVNTVWAQVAERVGKRTLARYMDRFGFNALPQLDYPAGQMTPSGEYLRGRLIAPTSPLVDVGRMGIGQDKLQVTPLQMAQVAAAVANHGQLMVPHMTARIVDPEGRTVERIAPRVQSDVMRSATATELTTMMEAVVNEGTGTAAQIPGVQVAGKTGTAETQIGTAINNVWFIAFAPATDPRVAIAVTLEHVPGFGGVFAAPIAKHVMEVLLHD